MRFTAFCVVVFTFLCAAQATRELKLLGPLLGREPNGFSIGSGFGVSGEVGDFGAEVSPEFTFTLDPAQSPEEPEDDEEAEDEKEEPCERFFDPHTRKIFCLKDGIYRPTGEIYKGAASKHVVYHYGKGK